MGFRLGLRQQAILHDLARLRASLRASGTEYKVFKNTLARRAAEFGVTVPGNVSVDMKRVKERKDGVSGNSRTGLETWLKGMKNCTVFQGHARFESAREVSVAAERITADLKHAFASGDAVFSCGGIGATLNTAFDRYEFDSAAAILLIIIAIVMLCEYGSGYLRRRVQ